MEEKQDMSTTQRIVLMAHGWAYTHLFFEPMLRSIEKKAPDFFNSTLFACIDQVYFAKHTTEPCLMILNKGQWQAHPLDTLNALVLAHAEVPWTGLGHSLGFAKLLQLSVRWRKLVSVHGFTHFCKSIEKPSGIAPRLLKKMIDKLQTEPAQLVHDFQNQCGHLLPLSTRQDTADLLNLHTSLLDLQWMLTLNTHPHLYDLLAASPAKAGQTELLAIYSPSDVIVPNELSQACFKPLQTEFPAQVRTQAIDAPHAALFTQANSYTEMLLPFLVTTY